MKKMFLRIMVLFQKIRSAVCFELTLRRWTLWVLGCLLGILLAAALLVFLLDPCFRYRYPSICKPLYQEPRMQIPGILRNGNYDFLLLGSSMCQNFTLSDLRSAFDVKNPEKGTIPSLRTAEVAVLLDIVSEKNSNVPILCYGFDMFSVSPQLLIKSKLYDIYYEKPFTANECRYFFNDYVWKEMVGSVLRWQLFRARSMERDADHNLMFSWKVKSRHKWGAERLRKVLQIKWHRPPAPIPPESAVSLTQEHITSRLARFPNTRIVILLPPYSLVYWSMLDAGDHLETMQQTRKAILSEFMKLPNVEIYDYNTADDIITDLNNYIDITHYHPKINTEITKRLARGEGRLKTIADVDRSNRKLTELVKKYQKQYEKDGLRFRY